MHYSAAENMDDIRKNIEYPTIQNLSNITVKTWPKQLYKLRLSYNIEKLTILHLRYSIKYMNYTRLKTNVNLSNIAIKKGYGMIP